MSAKISKDANKLLKVIFKEYKRRRKAGVSINQAKKMNDDVWIHENLMPKWPLDDVTSLCYVLRNSNFLSIGPSDNHAYLVFLTDEGIVYAENKINRCLNRWFGRLKNIRDLLPPL